MSPKDDPCMDCPGACRISESLEEGGEALTIDFERFVIQSLPTSFVPLAEASTQIDDTTTTENTRNDVSEDLLKEWIWKSYKDEILSNMTIRRTEIVNKSSSSINIRDGGHKEEEEEKEEKTEEDKEEDSSSSVVVAPTNNDDGIANTACSNVGCCSLASDKQLELLERVAHAQRKYLQSEGPMAVYNCLLEGLLEMMGSEFGFIGEARYDHNNVMYLHIHVSTDISWDDDTRRFYEKHHKAGLDFYHLNNLFGRVLLDKVPIIANDAKNDPRATGLPPGHPNVKSFLGVPIFAEGGELLGMFAVANKPTGYGRRDVKFLEPFTHTCSNVIQAYFANEENKRLITTLKSANEQLELANKRVISASELQLRHFACMSHEIRTPLNCIIGMLSLLLKSELTPMQQESMSLQHTMDTVTRSIIVKAATKDISLRTIYDPKVADDICTDHLRLQQVLFNLLGNAVKFSKDNGTVELHVSVVDEDKDKLPETCHTYYASDTESETEESSCVSSSSNTVDDSTSTERPILTNEKKSSPSKNRLRFTVKDYGKGLESNEFENVFRPFFQTEDETKKVHGGTGLGLAITAKLVHGLGGTISVDSKFGEWSCFTVEFPLTEEPQDLCAMSQELSGLEIILVNPDRCRIVEEELLKKLRAFGLSLFVLSKMDKMDEILQRNKTQTKPNRKYACLVHEDLYEEDLYTSFSEKTKVVLLTYGPKFSVKQAREHFRCPLEVLPSVLVKRIATHMAAIDDEPAHIFERSNRLSGRIVDSTIPKHPKNFRILVAEDNKINQKVIMGMLKRIGVDHFQIANNGLEAVKKESAIEFDLVLMDIQMPVMDGIEACKAIVARKDGHPRPPIVFVTAHAMISHEVECSKAGGSGFLTKPYKIDKIEEILLQYDGSLDR